MRRAVLSTEKSIFKIYLQAVVFLKDHDDLTLWNGWHLLTRSRQRGDLETSLCLKLEA